MRDEPVFDLDSDDDAARQRYCDVGYVIFRNLIEGERIDAALSALAAAKRNPFLIYYSQSVHRWLRPRFSSGGYLMDSMENPSWHVHLPALRKATMDVIYHPNISSALEMLSGQRTFVSWQDMLFDRSVGTIDHQDSWYLDTRPPGQLIAAWFALEDIVQDSGPFVVYPRSHLLPRVSEDEYPQHDDFVAKIRDVIAESNLPKKEMLLPKGHVLFWHPSLIHGADMPEGEAHSRKSLTSHYYPRGLARKDTVSLEQDLVMMKSTGNSRMYRKGIPEMPFVVKGHVKWLRDAVLRKTDPIIPMSRSAYK